MLELNIVSNFESLICGSFYIFIENGFKEVVDNEYQLETQIAE